MATAMNDTTTAAEPVDLLAKFDPIIQTREQLLAAVEDRLAAKENFRQVGVGHGDSLVRGF